MKKLANIALMAILAICFASCEKEQSSFEVADIKTTANIRGTIMQNLGQDYKNGKYIENIVPAANKKIYIEINNSELAPNDAKGVTVFETTTNENGEYEINVPVVYGGTEVTVKAEQFIGTYKKVVDVDNNLPIYEEKEGVYDIEDDVFTLNPQDIKFCDAVYYIDYRDLEEGCKYNSTFIVQVGKPQYSIDKQKIDGVETEFISRNYVTASGVDVIATINGKCYGATTNNNGEATFIIPSDKKEWTANVQIETTPYIVNNFNYIKNVETEKYVEEVVERLIEKQVPTGEYDYWGEPIYETVYETVYETIITPVKLDVPEKFKIESGIMSISRTDTEEIYFSGIANDKAPIIKAALGFEAHDDIENYGYSKSEWNYVELNF